jgi:hypothetical protein
MERKAMSGDLEDVELAVTRGAALHFRGKLLAEYSTQNRAKSKDRWTELRLWETVGGNWVAERVGCSDMGKERDLTDAAVLGPKPTGAADEMERRLAAMELWDWSTAARALARDLGWKFVQVVP